MALFANAPMEGSSRQGPSRTSVCATWLLYSPASSLSSQPCSPGPSGGRQHEVPYQDNFNGVSTTESVKYLLSGAEAGLPAKRPRLDLGIAHTNAQAYGRAAGRQAQNFHAATPPLPPSCQQLLHPVSGGWNPTAPRLSSGCSSSSADSVVTGEVRCSNTEKLPHNLTGLASLDGFLARSVDHHVQKATFTASRSSLWPQGAHLPFGGSGLGASSSYQSSLVGSNACQAPGTTLHPHCAGATFGSQLDQLLTLAAADLSTATSLPSWTSLANILPAATLASFPYIFTGTSSSATTAAPAKPCSLDLAAGLAQTSWWPASSSAPQQLCQQQPHVNICSAPALFHLDMSTTQRAAQAGLLTLGRQPQLAPANLLNVRPLAPPAPSQPSLPSRLNLVGPAAAAAVGFTVLDVLPQPPQQPLLLLQQPQQPLQPCLLSQLPQPLPLPQPQQQAQTHLHPQPQPQLLQSRRVRPPSPSPPCAPLPPPLPGSVGPEEWMLHVIKVLGMREPDTARLALHCWRRVAGLPQLHHATRAAAAGGGSVEGGRCLYATACLWISIKLEEKRRAAPGGVLLARLAATCPAALSSAELAVMVWLEWRPYEGYRLDESHLLEYM
ncbi:hypothetical protein Agub_g14834 [Astrephomene gubernaculifera]|uniref:Uncharacterized protein n=1 Tax=Astrephomene gubernaculifera TaxID=47775 RepID=A0AAD3HTI1_9CHLO|nr:hypothetical protein Agub_g14834 [Astrephomene gubernaculifera]